MNLYKNKSKVPKVVIPTNKKTFLKTLGTSVINRPMSPPFLIDLSLFTKKKMLGSDINAQWQGNEFLPRFIPQI